MATVNPWQRFKGLLPQQRRFVVTVDQVLADGTSLATRSDGSQVRLQGDSIAAGKKAWVEGQRIIGEAPDLPTATQFV